MSLRRILRLARPFRRRLVPAVGASLVGAALLAALAPLTGVVVGEALAGDRGGVLLGGGLAAAAVAGHLLAVWCSELLFADVSASLGARMRDDLASHVEGAALLEIERHDPGDLLARGGNEIDEVAAFATAQLPALLVAAGYLVVSLLVLLGHSVPLTLVLLVVYVPAAAVVFTVFRRRAHVAFSEEAARLGTLAGVIAEGATVAGALREPAAAAWWAERVDRANGRLRSAIHATVAALNLFPLLLAVEAAAIAVIIAVGAALVAAGSASIATVAVFVVASGTLFATFGQLGDALAALATARAYAARHFEIIDAFGPAPTSGASATSATSVRSATSATSTTAAAHTGVEVTDLRFAYPGRPAVLDGVTVSFPPGSRTVIVGPSGAGKSTLAKLLTGLYRPDQGSVRIGDAPAATARTATGARAGVLVTQESPSIPGTVRENLLLPEVLPDDDVLALARGIGLDDWLADLGGLDRVISARGLEAGDRQRLAVLRAATRQAAVLVLDESTASLDERISEALHAALDHLVGDRTLIVIAHHHDTIQRYERVVTVVPDGTVTVTEGGSACPTTDAASSR